MVIEEETDEETRVSVVRALGFCARSSVFTNGRVFTRHAHRSGHVVMVYEGEWTELAGSSRRVLHQGDVLFHPAGVEHETRVAGGTSVVVVNIVQTALGAFRGLYERAHLIRFDDVDGIPDRIHAEIARGDSATALVVNSLVLQLLAIGSRAATKPLRRKPDWISPLLAYIHANLGERLTVQRLAAVAAVSESHLSHSFNQFFECTLSDYIREARLRAAARALRHSGDSVQQIAWTYGF
jgi:AraC-like DNA-binding protein/quercetin dioxygenase-like cupin family protein